jgi:ParB family chromosome partitioning protein
MSVHRRLGRGLGGLLQSTVDAPATPEELRAASDLPITDLRPNPYQPRRVFDDAALQDLRASIAEHGLLQPIVVRRAPGGYEVIAGERRLRACKALGLERIPAIVREVDDAGMQTLALVENLQREDLNPLEMARALKAIMLTQGLTQEVVAGRVGKDRATIANLLRLLELPEDVRSLLDEGRLSFGQARAVLQVTGDTKRSQLARLAAERELSVREVERIARLTPGARPRSTKAVDPFLADLEQRLRVALGTKVRVSRKGKGGAIEIPYQDSAHLDDLLEKLRVS